MDAYQLKGWEYEGGQAGNQIKVYMTMLEN